MPQESLSGSFATPTPHPSAFGAHLPLKGKAFYNKKCAALGAAHEKCTTPIAATQFHTYRYIHHKYVKREYAFLPKAKKLHTYGV